MNSRAASVMGRNAPVHHSVDVQATTPHAKSLTTHRSTPSSTGTRGASRSSWLSNEADLNIDTKHTSNISTTSRSGRHSATQSVVGRAPTSTPAKRSSSASKSSRSAWLGADSGMSAAFARGEAGWK